MRNPPRNNPPYESPTGRHSALRFFFCPVFRAAGLFPCPCSPPICRAHPAHQLSRHKGLYFGGWPPDPPHHTFSPPFSFALLFPGTSPPGAPSAPFFAIALIGRPLSAGSPDVGLCFSRRSLSSPLRTFSPPFPFALPPRAHLHVQRLPHSPPVHRARPVCPLFCPGTGRTFVLPSPVPSACPHPASANPRTRKKTADVLDIRCFSVVIQIRIRRAASRIQSGRT